MQHDADFLSAAIIGYQEKLKQIDAHIANLRQRLHIAGPPSVASAPVRKKHKISRQGRARIAAAQKKRWAAVKKAKVAISAVPATKPAAKKTAAKQAAKRVAGRLPVKAAKRAATPKQAPQKRTSAKKPAAKKAAAKRASVVRFAVSQVTETPAPTTGTDATA
jgi:hypothetical protein